MDTVITENDYPVEFRWIYKSAVGFIIASIISLVLFFFGYINYYLYILVIYSPIHFILTILRRSNFHYALEEEYLTVKQGVISKKERHIPYEVIQNVFVKQDLTDRVFGLCSLAIENASQGKKGEQALNAYMEKRSHADTLGSKGNKVNIPGLKKENAEKLKELVLTKLKKNQAHDSGSGL